MEKTVLSKLNAAQKEAVLYFDSPLLILAGAGSGKTRTITHKIAYLIFEKGVHPQNILAMTFSNKAAAEMKKRVLDLLNNPSMYLWIATFHSTCLRILRKEGEKVGLSNNFIIYDEQDQLSIIKSCLKELNISEKDYSPSTISYYIDFYKNSNLTPSEVKPDFANFYYKTIIKVYELYQKKLLLNNACDFNDLLLNTVKLFKENPDKLEFYRNKWEYVLVDEYQDTNQVQYALLKMLASGKNNLFVVGDDDQSIYGWRGANVSNILNFQTDFPNSKIIKLEENYRSTQLILDAANSVISKNKGRLGKKLFTQKSSGDKITIYYSWDDKDEATYIADSIKTLTGSYGYSYNDIAIFYRTNAQSRLFEEELLKNGIPYILVGGYKFYERKEIKDIVAYLKFISNPKDFISFTRLINSPSRGVGEKSLAEIERIAFENSVNAIEALNIFATTKKKKELIAFAQMLIKYKEERSNVSKTTWLQGLLKESGMVEHYKEEKSEVSDARIDNISEFVNSFEEYFTQNPEDKLEDFLDKISLIADTDEIKSEVNKVTLMTLHCSKGLEFDIVFISGMEEGLFPHKRTFESFEETEEERRLCYVGITRTKRKLFLTCSGRRRTWGNYNSCKPSRYLTDLPGKFIESYVSEKKYFDQSSRYDW